jgi:hypothetical protein
MVETTPSALSPQLQAVAAELEEARAWARRLVAGLDPAVWGVRPGPERWSIAEQIVHLSLTSRAYVSLIEEALRRGREQGLSGAGPFRRDFLGWLLCRMIEPPVRIKTRTAAPFVPAAVEPVETAMREFEGWQDELIDLLGQAHGLALDRIRIASPFDARVRYNLFSGFRVVAAHQRHHLWIAERIQAELTSRIFAE